MCHDPHTAGSQGKLRLSIHSHLNTFIPCLEQDLAGRSYWLRYEQLSIRHERRLYDRNHTQGEGYQVTTEAGTEKSSHKPGSSQTQ